MSESESELESVTLVGVVGDVVGVGGELVAMSVTFGGVAAASRRRSVGDVRRVGGVG